MTFNTWSKTAASNSNADSTINFSEGQAPSSVNDSARALMAAAAKFRDDNAGALTTGGTSTAFTLTSNQVFASLTAMNGMSLRVKFSATNGAAPTLNVDGLGAKAIQTVSGTAVATGAILANSIWNLVYDNSASSWILIGTPNGVLNAPSGTLMLFMQSSPPTGWTISATHNDKALRIVSSSPGSGGSTAFSSVFAARTIAQANLPNVNFTITATAAVNPTMHVRGLSAVAGTTPVPCDAANETSLAALASFISSGGSPYTVTGTAASGGSGTALDFAVQYADVIAASKD